MSCRKWLKGVQKAAMLTATRLPFERGAPRAAMIARRKAKAPNAA